MKRVITQQGQKDCKKKKKQDREMEKLPQLNQRSSEEKDALIHKLWEKNQKLEAELKKYRKNKKDQQKFKYSAVNLLAHQEF